MGTRMRLPDGDHRNRRATAERPGEHEALTVKREAKAGSLEFDIPPKDQVPGLRFKADRSNVEIGDRRPGDTPRRIEAQHHEVVDVDKFEFGDERRGLSRKQHRAQIADRIGASFG